MYEDISKKAANGIPDQRVKMLWIRLITAGQRRILEFKDAKSCKKGISYPSKAAQLCTVPINRQAN